MPRVITEGYQPVANNQKNGHQPSSKSGTVTKIVPPKGGTGRTVLKKK